MCVKMLNKPAQEAVMESWLEPGERVIVHPSDAVRDGGRVLALESGSK
jgi:phage repressor protein C with HTH and peptisase S24 domain